MSALSPEAFLEELVRIRSLSGEELAASEFVVTQMKLLGFRAAYVDSAGSAVGVWGKTGGSPRIVLLGHVDTVPGEIPVRVQDGILHGRGSVDAKGPLATFIQATAQLPPDIGAEIVVIGATEEEAATSKGARQALLDWSVPDFCVIGEPSGTNGVTLGYKGRLLATITAKRPGTHTAHPHQSAAEAAIAIHSAILAKVRLANEEKVGIFERLDLSLRSFNTYSSGIEDSAEMVHGFRLGPTFDPDQIEAEIQTAIAETALDSEFEVAVAVTGKELPIRRDRRNPLVAAFFASIRSAGLEPKTVVKTGTADMNVVGPHWNGPIVAFGPGDSSLDHTPDERLSLDEYRTAIEILRSVLERLASPTSP